MDHLDPWGAGAEPPPLVASSHLAAEDVPSFPVLQDRICMHDADACGKIHQMFYGDLRTFFTRHFGPDDAGELAHKTILFLITAIQQRRILHPTLLPAFLRGIAKNVMRDEIRARIKARARGLELREDIASDSRSNPEAEAIQAEKLRIMERVLRSMSVRDRELLARYYILGHSRQQICADLGLTETQFRLQKSRAKAKITERCQGLVSRKPPTTSWATTRLSQTA